MSVVESANRFPGLPAPAPDAVTEMLAERDAALAIVSRAMEGPVSPLVQVALEAAYAFGRLDAIRYARRLIK